MTAIAVAVNSVVVVVVAMMSCDDVGTIAIRCSGHVVKIVLIHCHGCESAQR